MAVVPLYDTLGLEAMVHILNLGENLHVEITKSTVSKILFLFKGIVKTLSGLACLPAISNLTEVCKTVVVSKTVTSQNNVWRLRGMHTVGIVAAPLKKISNLRVYRRSLGINYVGNSSRRSTLTLYLSSICKNTSLQVKVLLSKSY